MTETYLLNGPSLPSIPTPHDCVVTRISLEGRFLTLYFEDDIAAYDSIEHQHPGAKSLIIRYHLTGEDSFEFLRWRRGVKPFFPNGFFARVNPLKLHRLTAQKLEYLYHYVGWCTVVVKLFSRGYVILEADADRVELEWIE